MPKHFACVWPSTTHRRCFPARPCPRLFNPPLYSHWPVCTTSSTTDVRNLHAAEFLFQNWLSNFSNFDMSEDNHWMKEKGEREISVHPLANNVHSDEGVTSTEDLKIKRLLLFTCWEPLHQLTVCQSFGGEGRLKTRFSGLLFVQPPWSYAQGHCQHKADHFQHPHGVRASESASDRELCRIAVLSSPWSTTRWTYTAVLLMPESWSAQFVTPCGLYWLWGEMFVTKFGHTKWGYLQCINNAFHCASIHFLSIVCSQKHWTWKSLWCSKA